MTPPLKTQNKNTLSKNREYKTKQTNNKIEVDIPLWINKQLLLFLCHDYYYYYY